MEFEICTESFEVAQKASAYKIKRIELCSALDLGGLSPSYGLLMKCLSLKDIEIHAMIRPRAGDFIYNDDELEMMLDEIKLYAESGVKGVVFGCLDEEKVLDMNALEYLAANSKSLGLETTFHRAFDFIDKPAKALEILIDFGFTRILTSGGMDTAIEGIDNIQQLVLQSEGRIEIMAGSGVNKSNALIIAEAGVDALHFSAHKWTGIDEKNMGMKTIVNEAKIRNILNLFV